MYMTEILKTDGAYNRLRNKVKNNREVTTTDLIEALDLYETLRLELAKNQTKYIPWTEEEDEYLQYFVSCNDAPIREASEYLGRTFHSVNARIELLRKKGEISNQMKRGWTEEEEEYLAKNYYSIDVKLIADKLNRSVTAVRHKAKRSGIAKTMEQMEGE